MTMVIGTMSMVWTTITPLAEVVAAVQFTWVVEEAVAAAQFMSVVE